MRQSRFTEEQIIAILAEQERGLKTAEVRHQELICFVDTTERQVPAGKFAHATLDNYATQKEPKVRTWPARHPR